MSDLIDRKALCDDLREYKVHPVPVSSDESEVKGYNDGIDLAISVITEFPSSEPERKKGEWNNYKDEHGCSVCQSVVIQENWDDDIRYDYCPYCGAEMRGE